MVAVGHLQGLDVARPVGAQLARVERLADAAGRVGEAPGEGADVDVAGALLAQAREGGGQRLVAQLLAHVGHPPPLAQEAVAGLRTQARGGADEVLVEGPADDVAEARQLLRRRQQLAPVARAVAGMQRGQPPGQAGHRATAEGARLGQEQQRLGALVGDVVHHAGATAAEPDARGHRDRHREGHRHGRVGGGAVLPQDRAPDQGRARLVRRGDAGEAGDGARLRQIAVASARAGAGQQRGGERGQGLSTRRPVSPESGACIASMNWEHA